MSAEQTLLVHWRACVESRDRVCVSAFADHLMELWSTAVQEDSDYYSMTGAVAPVLRLIHNGHQLNVDHGDFEGRVELRFFGPVGGRRIGLFDRSRTADSPSSWDFEQANNFIDWIMSLIDSPAILHERSGTPTTGGLHG